MKLRILLAGHIVAAVIVIAAALMPTLLMTERNSVQSSGFAASPSERKETT